jgi:hypothetical protein
MYLFKQILLFCKKKIIDNSKSVIIFANCCAFKVSIDSFFRLGLIRNCCPTNVMPDSPMVVPFYNKLFLVRTVFPADEGL